MGTNAVGTNTVTVGGAQFGWVAPATQPPSEVYLNFRNGELLLWLCDKHQAGDPEFYRLARQATGREIRAVGVAAGAGQAISYPDGVQVIEAPMFHRGFPRGQGVAAFYVACERAAGNGEAVVCHCGQGFHRAPLLLAAVARLAGHNVQTVLEQVAFSRDMASSWILHKTLTLLVGVGTRSSRKLAHGWRGYDGGGNELMEWGRGLQPVRPRLAASDQATISGASH